MATFKMVACSNYHFNLHERLAVARIKASHICILKCIYKAAGYSPRGTCQPDTTGLPESGDQRFRVIESPASLPPCILVVDLYLLFYFHSWVISGILQATSLVARVSSDIRKLSCYLSDTTLNIIKNPRVVEAC